MTAKKIFILAANLGIALIVVQTWLKPFPDMILSGAEKDPVVPPLSLSSLNDRTFQDAVEQWFSRKVGFRGFLVKSDNQIKYSVFSEFSQSHPRKIILGKEKYLYQEHYISMLNRTGVQREDVLRKKAASLKKLQDALLARHVSFLLVISPNKAVIYPEYIPERYLLRNNFSRKDNYQVFAPLLRTHGVNVLDGREMFLDLKRRSVPNLFPTSGIHWSLYGGCLVAERLIERMEGLMGRRLVHVTHDEIVKSREPIELDKDLARLANILFTRSLFTEYLYPKTRTVAAAGAYRPAMLIVGSSFCWNIIEYLDRNRTFSSMDFFYYFNTCFTYPGKSSRHIERTALDWEREIRSRDVVIIEMNEASMTETGYGFIEEALAALGR